MDLRAAGKQSFTSPRKEADQVILESGVFEGKTTGAPILLRIENKNTRSSDYESFRHTPRPGHADFSMRQKHPHHDFRGGGRSSARETAARVAAAVVAKKILTHLGIEVFAFVDRIGPKGDPTGRAKLEDVSWQKLREERGQNPFYALAETALLAEWSELAYQAKEEKDSWGGSVFCAARGVPAGLGEPCFDKLPAVFSHALMSLPAATCFEWAGGFSRSKVPGSLLRDPIGPGPLGVAPLSNIHGGSLGGISTGLPLEMRVHFHAPTSIAQPIQSWNYAAHAPEEISVQGRHDALPLPRAVPMVEAMAALVLVDFLFRAGKIPQHLE